MAARKPQAKRGLAETPAPLPAATDNPAGAEATPAAPPVDQSTGAAGPEAGAVSTHASEQAAGEGAASAAAGIAAAPAALPTGAAAGVDPITPREARGSSASTDSLVLPDTGEAVSTAPGGEASADPAGASPGDVDALMAAVAALGDEDVPVFPPAPEIDPSGQAFALDDEVVAAVMASVTRRRGGRKWTAGQIELIREGEMSDEQLRQLEADPGFHVKRVAP